MPHWVDMPAPQVQPGGSVWGRLSAPLSWTSVILTHQESGDRRFSKTLPPKPPRPRSCSEPGERRGRLRSRRCPRAGSSRDLQWEGKGCQDTLPWQRHSIPRVTSTPQARAEMDGACGSLNSNRFYYKIEFKVRRPARSSSESTECCGHQCPSSDRGHGKSPALQG